MTRNADVEKAILRVREGEPEAFEFLVRTFEWQLRTWIVAQAPPGIDSDEIAQRTFIEVFHHIAQYRPGTDFKAWLITTARYQLMAETTRLRRLADYHRRFIPRSLDLELERRAQTESSEISDRLDRLRGCLAKLEGPARDLVQMRYDEAVPLDEISRRTGRKVGALKKALFVLRARLHDCITGSAAPEVS